MHESTATIRGRSNSRRALGERGNTVRRERGKTKQRSSSRYTTAERSLTPKPRPKKRERSGELRRDAAEHSRYDTGTAWPPLKRRPCSNIATEETNFVKRTDRELKSFISEALEDLLDRDYSRTFAEIVAGLPHNEDDDILEEERSSGRDNSGVQGPCRFRYRPLYQPITKGYTGLDRYIKTRGSSRFNCEVELGTGYNELWDLDSLNSHAEYINITFHVNISLSYPERTGFELQDVKPEELYVRLATASSADSRFLVSENAKAIEMTYQNDWTVYPALPSQYSNTSGCIDEEDGWDYFPRLTMDPLTCQVVNNGAWSFMAQARLPSSEVFGGREGTRQFVIQGEVMIYHGHIVRSPEKTVTLTHLRSGETMGGLVPFRERLKRR